MICRPWPTGQAVPAPAGEQNCAANVLNTRGEDRIDNRVIEVVVGLTGLFLFMSLVVTHLVEIFSAFIGRRGNHLADAIRDLLGRATGDAVLNHPLLRGLRFPAGRLPSYIPSPLFAEALIDVITRAQPGTGDATSTEAAGTSDIASITDHIWRVASVSGPAVVQAQVERWFDSAMERLSGAYKRHTQAWTFAIGAILVVVMNANAIGVARALWREPVVRQAATKAAGEELAQCSAAPDKSVTCSDFKSIDALAGLPLGWGHRPTSFVEWAIAAFGWLLSALAVSLGAPFWFDVLKKVAPGVRLSGGTPSPAQPPPTSSTK
jgi:hypothetical protein